MIHFVYLWFDTHRNMFYVGQHSGEIDDGYISSNHWLNGEIKYRPKDFKRRILKIFDTKNDAQLVEGKLLSYIKVEEFGVKYYNSKHGKPKGKAPWNKGKRGEYSDEYRKKLSDAKKGKPGVRLGSKNKTK